MEEVTFAVIGAGFMGDVLARVGYELPYARCVAAVDVKPENAQRLVASYGGAAYQDHEEMLERECPDTVIIATPESSHCAPVLAASQHGSHIFVEKPFATSLEDADAMIQSCEDAGVKLMVGHILRVKSGRRFPHLGE